MARSSLTVEEILSLLNEAPPRIAAHVEGLDSTQLHTPPQPDEWSINDILAHLRSCADVWGDCISQIITEDRPTIRAVNPRTWITKTDYLVQEFQPSFQAFTTQRGKLVKVLESLPQADWSRAATVTGAGKPLEKTVYSYAERLVVHERSHINQIRRVAKAMLTQQ